MKTALIKKLLFICFWLICLGYIFPSSVQALSISDPTQQTTTPRVYEKFEASFNIADSTAANFQYPYDAQTIAGLTNRQGITVNGLFLPPGETDWNEALVQPAFLYQPMLKDAAVGGADSEWMYPSGAAYWLVRFSPQIAGNWQYKIRAQDSSICTAGVDPCTSWVESAVKSFSADPPADGNHGFIKVSPTDSRYFEYSDGKPFVGLGHGTSFSVEKKAPAFFSKVSASKLNFFRAWMSSALIFGRGTSGWNPWRNYDSKKSTQEVYPGHDFSIKLTGNNDFIYQYTDGNQYITGGLEAGKTYKVRLRAKLNNVVPAATGTNPKGLVVLLTTENTATPTVNLALTPTGFTGTTDWQVLESTFINNRGRIVFTWGNILWVGLRNITSGDAYIDEIYIGEDLGGGQVGPNVVFKGQMNYHLYFDQISSTHWEEIIKSAEANKVLLRPVLLDKDDLLFGRIRPETGIYDSTISWDVVDQQLRWNNFYALPNTKVRRLMEYFWRYLSARWGYSTAIHSWEILNEGDPGNGRHRDLANSFSKFMTQNDAQKHLAGTSTWATFPISFWSSSSYPDVTHADIHAYVSTSWAPSADKNIMQYDAAYFHVWHSQNVASQNIGKPVIRGELGIDSPTQQVEQAGLTNDTRGVWLHNFLWSTLDPGGLYENYWWTNNITSRVGPDNNAANGLYEVFTPVADFMDNIPLSNGKYQDAQPQISSGNVRAWGQKDNKTGGNASRAHLWIQNKNHTWKNVVDNVSWGRLSGTITIAGFSPSTSYPIEWWDFVNEGTLNKRTSTITSNGSGEIVLNLDSLDSSVTDTAVKIGDYTTAGCSSSDVTGDCQVNLADALSILVNWLKNAPDTNNDGKVNSLDFGGLIKDWD